MDVSQRNIRVLLVREDWEDLAEYPLPAGWSIRWYAPGDEAVWGHIQAAADYLNAITPDLFTRQFGEHPLLLAARQCFLVNPAGQAVGTGTAWFNDNFQGRPYGRVHWVALLPEFQGQGLAKPLMSVICRRLRELGHDRAYLTTSTARIPAIQLYRRFGFVPFIRSAYEADMWEELDRIIG
jgi:GNAT superfamily N-acetyltransferase